MAKSRKLLKEFKGVKFQSFPLVLEKRGKNTDIYIFGGRYFSIFANNWRGVRYEGRYRFHIPSGKDVTEGIWDLRKMKEKVRIVDARGERLELEREYFTIYPTSEAIPKFYADFIGGYRKTTLSGVGRNINYIEYTRNEDVVVLATTSNSCRSGRYGSYASFVISSTPIEIEGVMEE